MARTPGSGFVTEAMLEEALESQSGTSGTVTSVNGVGPDSSGNVTIPLSGGGGGGAGLTEDPDHPGLYLINTVQNVTAAAPTFTDQDGTTNDRYTIPAVTGVEYRVNGALRSAGVYTPTAGQSITVTATALAGYTLTGTSTWSYTFSTGIAPVSITANVPTADDTANTVTWTPKAGVEYVIGGQVRTPPYSVGDVDATVTVAAQAQAGYVLTGTTSWTFTFTKAPSSPASDYAAAVLADSPVVFYRLNEPAGATPVDATGNTTATVNGSVTLGDPEIIPGATSAKFDGSTGYLSLGNPAALQAGTPFTIELLMKNMGDAAGHLVSKDDSSGSRGGRLYLGSRTFGFQAGSSPGVASDAEAFEWGTPAHMAVTGDGTNVTFYVNGAQVGQKPYAGLFGGARALEIGRRDAASASSYYKHWMGGVAVYDKVLTPARILAHAQAASLAS